MCTNTYLCLIGSHDRYLPVHFFNNLSMCYENKFYILLHGKEQQACVYKERAFVKIKLDYATSKNTHHDKDTDITDKKNKNFIRCYI